ncbi:hypothetical protein P280DRAFT_512267 [Massarina eburnea CBS 473.64]|uniref:C3H1-type domain-containing protein n=1 Tax=Massarina eburnea CBS 473.64 TaxID=1395130 RepID=A0A6A6SEV1_9PLEO|nr:hypothetical protein P280DRAFT_512267 [Massarina eburnea CBS 473.64]
MNGGGVKDDMSILWARFDRIQQSTQESANLTNELLLRLEYMSQEQARIAARLPEQDRAWQHEKKMYEERLRVWENLYQRNPFVVILVDGDGMIFRDEYIRQGEAGGFQAAVHLQKEIEHHIQHEAMDVPVNSRIICRVYANVGGLASTLVRANIISEISLFEDFVRGFTRAKTLFDFVDVGSGKDRADDKISEMFKLSIDDFHCRHIFFGCSHDNGFARLLEKTMDDDSKVKRVVLLEGAPFEKELLSLPYKTKKLDGLFRDSKLNVHKANGINTGVQAVPTVQKNYSIVTGLPSRFPPAPSRASSNGNGLVMDSPNFANVAPNLPRTPSTSTLASDGLPAAIKPMMNWAEKAAAPPPPIVHPSSPKYEPVNREEVIARNRAGQRVDPQTRDYDKAEVDRVKKIKMCNVHFLRRECPYGTNCTHLHHYEPTPSELATLRLVARMAPCQNGSGCQDIKCIYGHRCPAPPSKTNRSKGKSCIFGESCKFPPELHDLDCNVVKTLVIR